MKHLAPGGPGQFIQRDDPNTIHVDRTKPEPGLGEA